MTPKEAVARAKQELAELFDGEGISNLRLEEIGFEPSDKTWKVTLGFDRNYLARGAFLPMSERVFKSVILGADGVLIAVQDRGLLDA